MEILMYLIPAIAGIVLWIIITEVLERVLDKKTDEVSRIKRASRTFHSHVDHNTQYRHPGVSSIILWKKDEIDPVTEERMRQSVKTQVKDKENE